MAKCDSCGTTILLGGKRQDGLRFCNDKCQSDGQLLAFAKSLPKELVLEKLGEVYNGSCPKCGGRGPVDVHNSYRIWSLLVLTSWSTHPIISCRSCARNQQLGHLLFSMVAGWWGFPWGIFITPVQLVRNVVALMGGPKPGNPSPILESFVRRQVAGEIAIRSEKNQIASAA
jgi:hypothetical protein